MNPTIPQAMGLNALEAAGCAVMIRVNGVTLVFGDFREFLVVAPWLFAAPRVDERPCKDQNQSAADANADSRGRA